MTKTTHCWFIVNDLVEEGDAIRRDYDGWHIVGHGYVPCEFVYGSEKDAKKKLIELLELKIPALQARLEKLRAQV